jgi:hypothetical protein
MRMAACFFLLAGISAWDVSAEQKRQIPLPHSDEWTAESADYKSIESGTELFVPVNYKVGRAVSPRITITPGEQITLAADVKSRFDGSQPTFFRCWLEVEFLDKDRVLGTTQTPPIIGTQAEPDLLAVTAIAPAGTTSLRVAVCAQNKFWSNVDNRVTVTGLRLVRLSGKRQGEPELSVTAGLPKRQDERSAVLELTADWPEDTAFAVSTSLGITPRSVLLTKGRVEIPLHFAAAEVGTASIEVSTLDWKATAAVNDPVAGRLEVKSVLGDGHETPALVRLTQNGEMLPGRYQASMPGIFMKAPWSIDLAPGEWHLQVCRGPEFQAFEQKLSVVSGQPIRLDNIVLRRNVDPRSEGWYGGDADGDVYHGERIYTDVSAQTAVEIALAMGMDWIGCGNWDTPNPQTWGEARAALQQLSRPNLLFLWTDEKPKSREGHVCLVGIERPDDDPFAWGWTGARQPLRNHEQLQLNRASGAATFVNHPLRWWTSGERFKTNKYAALPFDMCAARLLDGYNVNEKPDDLKVWSMLLDHGYPVAATAGTDFCLDRPAGPPPGKTRMYCYCPEGLSGQALAEAVRNSHTVVSSGPILMADINGRPPGTRVLSGQAHTIRAEAWADGSQADDLVRIELWSHGRAIATESIEGKKKHASATFEWTPHGSWDWVAVRVVSRRGWAMTSAFYAATADWSPPSPVECEVTLNVSGLSAADRQASVVEVWDKGPALATSRKVSSHPLTEGLILRTPVTSVLVVRAGNGQRREISVYDSIGVAATIERIANGAERERPLLNWETYEEVLSQCRHAKYELQF